MLRWRRRRDSCSTGSGCRSSEALFSADTFTRVMAPFHPTSVLSARGGRLVERLIDDSVDEAPRLLLVVGLEVGRRHLQAHDALLRLAVLQVPEPREHRRDLTACCDEVCLVDEPPAVLLTELFHLPEVEAVVAAGDRGARERLSAQHRFRLGRLEIRADWHARLEPPGWRREHDQVVVTRLRLGWNGDLAGLVAELSRENRRELRQGPLHRKL